MNNSIKNYYELNNDFDLDSIIKVEYLSQDKNISRNFMVNFNKFANYLQESQYEFYIKPWNDNQIDFEENCINLELNWWNQSDKIKIFQSYSFANFNKIIPVNLEPNVGIRTPINSK